MVRPQSLAALQAALTAGSAHTWLSGPEVNEYVLVSLFQSRFPSCKSAKIMTDPISGISLRLEVSRRRAQLNGVRGGGRQV